MGECAYPLVMLFRTKETTLDWRWALVRNEIVLLMEAGRSRLRPSHATLPPRGVRGSQRGFAAPPSLMQGVHNQKSPRCVVKRRRSLPPGIQDHLIQPRPQFLHGGIGENGVRRADRVGVLARAEDGCIQSCLTHLAGRALGALSSVVSLRTLHAIVAGRALRSRRSTGIPP